MAACCSTITAVLLMLTFWAHRTGQIRQDYLYDYYILPACMGYTCVNIPYGTLCGAMTQDIDERAKINTSRSVAV